MNKLTSNSNITTENNDNSMNGLLTNNSEKKLVTDNMQFTRSYNFDKEIVYKAFTKAKYLQQWFGTLQSKITFCEVDLKIGGKLSLVMESIQGKRQFSGEYFDIRENEKLIFSLNAIDKGEIFYETLNTVLFKEVEPGTTTVSVNVDVVKAVSEKSGSAIKGTTTGWLEGLKKLEKLLTTVS